MESLNEEQVKFLSETVTFLGPVKIEEALIDETGFKAIDDSSTLAILSTGAPTFPGRLGLVRLGQLKSRLDLVKTRVGFSVDYTTEVMKDDGDPEETEVEVINNLNLRAGTTKASYRAGNPFKIRAPKRPSFKILAYFGLADTTVSQIQGAISAFGPAKGVRFTFHNGIISVEVNDDNGDNFSTEIGEVEGLDEDLSYVYNAERVASIFKLALSEGSLKVGIGERGVLTVEKGSFSFYLMPTSK